MGFALSMGEVAVNYTAMGVPKDKRTSGRRNSASRAGEMCSRQPIVGEFVEGVCRGGEAGSGGCRGNAASKYQEVEVLCLRLGRVFGGKAFAWSAGEAKCGEHEESGIRRASWSGDSQ